LDTSVVADGDPDLESGDLAVLYHVLEAVITQNVESIF
jgi:hypothetical protein